MQDLIETLRNCWGYVQRRREPNVPRNTYPEHIMRQLEALGWVTEQIGHYYVTQAGLDLLAELESLEVLWPEQAAAEHSAHRPLVAALEVVTEALADSIDSICQHYATSACNSSAMQTLAMRRLALIDAARTILTYVKGN